MFVANILYVIAYIFICVGVVVIDFIESGFLWQVPLFWRVISSSNGNGIVDAFYTSAKSAATLVLEWLLTVGLCSSQ